VGSISACAEEPDGAHPSRRAAWVDLRVCGGATYPTGIDWYPPLNPWHQPQTYGPTSTVAFYDPWPTPLPEPPHPRERSVFDAGRPAFSGARPRCRSRAAPPHVRAYAPRPVRTQHRA